MTRRRNGSVCLQAKNKKKTTLRPEKEYKMRKENQNKQGYSADMSGGKVGDVCVDMSAARAPVSYEKDECEDCMLEVKTSYLGASREVRHMKTKHTGQASRATVALLALGGLLFFISVSAFAAEILRLQKENQHQKEVASFLKTRGLSARFVPKVKGNVALGLFSLTASFLGITLMVTGFARHGEEKESPDFTIGSDPVVDLPTSQRWLPKNLYRFPLIKKIKTGYVLLFTPQMQGSVKLRDRKESKELSLEEAIECKKAVKDPRMEGVFCMSLDGVESGTVGLGDNTVDFQFVSAEPSFHAKMSGKSTARVYYILSFAGHALLLFLLLTVPKGSDSMVSDSLQLKGRYRRLVAAKIKDARREEEVQLQEREKKEKVEDQKKTDKEIEKNRSSRRRDERLQKNNSEKNVSPGNSAGNHRSRNAGIAGVLGRMSGRSLASVFGRDTAVSADAENALSHLIGESRDIYGMTGLTPGSGRSGNPSGIGGINLGTWGTGIGDGGGNNPHFGPGGRPDGYSIDNHKTKRPDVIPEGKAEVIGTITPAMIRRVIRRRLSEIRYCYVAQGLSQNDKLSGQVKVSFIIGGNGRITTAGIAYSSLNHSPTENCICRTVRRWSFPKPPSGIVQVTYAFNFRPGS